MTTEPRIISRSPEPLDIRQYHASSTIESSSTAFLEWTGGHYEERHGEVIIVLDNGDIIETGDVVTRPLDPYHVETPPADVMAPAFVSTTVLLCHCVLNMPDTGGLYSRLARQQANALLDMVATHGFEIDVDDGHQAPCPTCGSEDPDESDYHQRNCTALDALHRFVDEG